MRFGTFSEIELLELAQKNNVKTLVLTDINNTSASLNFVRIAKEYNITPILGIDFRNGVQQQFIGIAKNNEGFQELNDFLSKHLQQKLAIPEKAPFFENAFVIYPFEKILASEISQFAANEFIGVSIAELRKLKFSKLSNKKKNPEISIKIKIKHPEILKSEFSKKVVP